MSQTVKGFTVKDQTPHGRVEIGNVVVNPGKVLPATATGNLFQVNGWIVVNGLVGVVSTVFAVTAVNIKLGSSALGAGGVANPAAIAANPAVAYASTAVGSVIVPPPALGGPLPAPIVAQTVVSSATVFVCAPGFITITTDATNTGAITWFLSWSKLFPKAGASVTAV